MKFLLDQNLSAAAAELLRASGTDVFHTREVELATAEDVDILQWCREQARILITLDADCHALLALSGATSPSVVRIRIEGLRDEALADLIRRVTQKRCAARLSNHVIGETSAALHRGVHTSGERFRRAAQRSPCVRWVSVAKDPIVAPAARRLDRRRLGGAYREMPASRWRSSRRAAGATEGLSFGHRTARFGKTPA